MKITNWVSCIAQSPCSMPNVLFEDTCSARTPDWWLAEHRISVGRIGVFWHLGVCWRLRVKAVMLGDRLWRE